MTLKDTNMELSRMPRTQNTSGTGSSTAKLSELQGFKAQALPVRKEKIQIPARKGDGNGRNST